jgi:flagellar FliL protein
MAKETPSAEQKPAAAGTAPKPLAIKKLVMIGVPVFLVQLVMLFFVATKFVGSPSTGPASQAAESAPPSKGEEGAEGPRMFVVKDLIVNPAGTNGTRFLLLTVGIEASTGEGLKELEGKEIQVRDVLNTVLTSKGLDELAGVERREELRGEIQTKLGTLIKAGAVTNVYFSKFIIQ